MTLTPITVLEGFFPTVLPLATVLKEEIAHSLCNYEILVLIALDTYDLRYTSRTIKEAYVHKYSFSEVV